MASKSTIPGNYVVGVRANRLLVLGPYADDDVFGPARGGNWLRSAEYCTDVYHVKADSLDNARFKVRDEIDRAERDAAKKKTSGS